MNQTCTNCGTSFEITDTDLQFYNDVGPTIGDKKFPIPPPNICPPCRMQRRVAFRNFFNLCHRVCDLSGKRIISMYRENAPFPVYEMHEWWSDKWDALEYGQDPDFNRPVFDQIRVLHETVPRMSILNTQCENTDYCNFSFQSKNCYLIGGNVVNEDCCYGHIVWQSNDCFDNLYIYRCQRCYECVDCFECYNVAFSRACENCSDSKFLVHCTGCKNCFGCVGLKNQEYHLFNQSLSKEEYEEKMKEFNSGSHKMIAVAQQKVNELIGQEIVKHYHGVNCEDVTGDYLYNCKNVSDSYDAKNCEDCRFLATAESFVHVYDGNYSPANTEWSYQLCAVDGHGLIACHNVLNSSSNLLYCENCFACKDCFGCEGLKNKQYCIFNKQYSEQEYAELLSKIIEHMQSTGEWGLFFPIELSPFGYNETMAYEYFPMIKEKVTAKGWQWRDEDKQEENYMGPKFEIPDDIKDATDDICDQILICEASGKPFKIIPQELAFHCEANVPLPRKCFLERHKERMALRNPRKLFDRKCSKCKKGVRTTYSKERPESVYCEECYLEEVY